MLLILLLAITTYKITKTTILQNKQSTLSQSPKSSMKMIENEDRNQELNPQNLPKKTKKKGQSRRKIMVTFVVWLLSRLIYFSTGFIDNPTHSSQEYNCIY